MAERRKIIEIKEHYDPSCPGYKWIELNPVLHLNGDHYCTLESQYRMVNDRPIPYFWAKCNHDNHQICPRFLKYHGITRTLEEEREEIVSSIPQTD